jgi:ferredoxin
MSTILWIIAIAALLLAIKNHYKGKSLLEEIDDLRNSYIDLRKDIKEAKESASAKLAILQQDFLASQGKLKAKKSAYRITEDCITCGSCKSECPADCIKEGEPYSIEIADCTGCTKCAQVCPVDACVPIAK